MGMLFGVPLLYLQRIVLSAFLFFPTQPLANTPPASSGFDPAIIAALIGLGGVVVGSLLTGVFVIYQVRRTAHVEKQRQEELFQHEKEMEQYRRLLDQKEKSDESEKQHREAAQIAMLRARTQEERIEAYRRMLRVDPILSRLQVLDMTQPLAISDIYVRLRVHQDTGSTFQVDPVAMEAEKQRDPNLLLAASQKHLEQRVASALTPEAALQTHKRCVVVGDPGAGKSTLLKYLALRAGERQLGNLPNLPLHIELSAFAFSKHRDLLEFAATIWDERYSFPKKDALDYLQAVFQQGEALLLCDALDETVTGTSREEAEDSYFQVSQAILNLATRYPLVPIIVTARKAGYHQRAHLTGFTELEVLDFRPEDISQFIQSWFTLHPNEQKRGNASDLLEKLQRHPRIETLAANPLLLTLITLVYEAQLDLPDQRAELYKQCVDTLLTKWDASRNIRRLREFKPEHKLRLLEEIAWHFHFQGQRYFSEPEVLECIATFLPAVGLSPEQNSQVLAEIAAENGLLKEQARGWHGFLHLTLQEYFVAQYAADHQQLEMLLAKRDDPWWEEVLLLYAGRLPDASNLLQHLVDETEQLAGVNQFELFHTDLLLAGRCLAAAAVVKKVSLRQNIISLLFTLLQTSPYILTQQHVAETLAEIGGTEIALQLVALLSNKQVSENAQMSIAKALGTLGERSVVPQLVALLSNKQISENVQISIAEALGALGERSIASQLVALLFNKQVSENVQISIAGSLGTLGERSVAPQLVALLSNEQVSEGVRSEVAGSLGALGERKVVPQMVALLTNEQIDSPRSHYQTRVSEDGVELFSSSLSVRGRIAQAVSTLEGQGVAPQLAALLSDQQINPFVRASIAYALGTTKKREIIPQLVALLSDEQIALSIRRNIVYVLGELFNEREVAPQLMVLLSDEQIDPSMRRGIAVTLGALGERSVAPQLVALLSNEQINEDVRMSIAEALGILGESTMVPQLVALLSNKQTSKNAQMSIAVALGRLGERSVAPRLVALLSNKQTSENVRRSIAITLGKLGERSVAPRLVALLSNKQTSEDLYRNIAVALGSLGERSVAPQLVALLSNKQMSISMMQNIANVLNTLSDRLIAPQLVALLSNKQVSKNVRARVATILSQVADGEKEIALMFTLLPASDIADSIYSALWTLSRRLGLRILVSKESQEQHMTVIKMREVLTQESP